METTHDDREEQQQEEYRTRDDIDNGPCDRTDPEEGTAYYVLMNSAAYGTEAWPCPTLEEAVGKLATLARSAEAHRRRDGIQRFFCIMAEAAIEDDGMGVDTPPPDPCAPEDTAATLELRIPTGAASNADGSRSPLRIAILAMDGTEAGRTPLGTQKASLPNGGREADRCRAMRRPHSLPCQCGGDGPTVTERMVAARREAER